MANATIQKLTQNQIILEATSEIIDYATYLKQGMQTQYPKWSSATGFAVVKDGKVVKSSNGMLEVYAKKSTANKVAEWYNNQAA